MVSLACAHCAVCAQKMGVPALTLRCSSYTAPGVPGVPHYYYPVALMAWLLSARLVIPTLSSACRSQARCSAS